MPLQNPATKCFRSGIHSESQFVKIRLRTEFKANGKTGPERGRISKFYKLILS